MLTTGGRVIDPDVAARPYDDLPFWARFILEHILPAVIVNHVEGGVESEKNAAAIEAEVDDTEEFDAAPESSQTTNANEENCTIFHVI
uniref:Uncharacterized protein n=1 Tax=Plectus sambesii TaxID=2011161 RepID=A0A914V3Y5_9BILA